MMNVWSAKPNVRPAASSFEKPSSASSATRMPRATKSMKTSSRPAAPIEAELLRDRGVDEVRVEERDDRLARGGRERALAEPGAAEAAVADRVEALDELVARSPGGARARPSTRSRRIVRPRVQPDRDALVHVRDEVVDERRRRRRRARGRPMRRRRAAGGDVEHREEDPELEERAAEVVRLHEHEHRGAPDQEQRPEVLDPPLRQHLPLVAQVAGEEDDQEDLRQLARLELERADLHPEAGAVDRLRRSPAARGASAAGSPRSRTGTCRTRAAGSRGGARRASARTGRRRSRSRAPAGARRRGRAGRSR